MVNICSTLECVRTRFGNRVQSTTNKVSLTNVKWRNDHLHFLNSINRYWVSSTRKTRRQAKVVVEICSIYGKVTQTAIATSKAHAIASIRRKTCKLSDATINRRQIDNLGVGDVRWGTSLLCREFRSPTTDDHFWQFSSILRHGDGQIVSLTKLQDNPFDNSWLIANVGNCHLIGATRTHTIDGEASRSVRHGSVTRSRRFVYSNDSGTDNLLAVDIVEGHLTCHTWSRDLSHGC